MLILDADEVRRALPMDRAVEAMKRAFAALAAGRAVVPLRATLPVSPHEATTFAMPAFVDEPGHEALAVKVASTFPHNPRRRLSLIHAAVLVLEPDSGRVLALLEGGTLTAIRTGATSGAATDLLAREDSRRLAILGSGAQARTQLEAVCTVRSIERVRVYSPTAENREAFAKRESERHGIPVEAAMSAEQAVRDADIICATTSSREPVLRGDWIAEGAHVNAVGASIAAARELDTAAVARARLYIDRRESTLNESGDFLLAKQEGAIDDEHIVGEIGEILLGRVSGRRTAEEITLFKSLGLAVEDLAAAHYVLARAREQGVGTEVALGGVRDAPA